MERQDVKLRVCQECGEPVYGRTDKRFCSDACRTCVNNRVKLAQAKERPACISRIQKALLTNHKILEQLRSRGNQLFSRLYLLDLGFNFHYHTSVVMQNEASIFYCFNHGYLLQKDQVVLVMQSDVFE